MKCIHFFIFFKDFRNARNMPVAAHHELLTAYTVPGAILFHETFARKEALGQTEISRHAATILWILEVATRHTNFPSIAEKTDKESQLGTNGTAKSWRNHMIIYSKNFTILGVAF